MIIISNCLLRAVSILLFFFFFFVKKFRRKISLLAANWEEVSYDWLRVRPLFIRFKDWFRNHSSLMSLFWLPVNITHALTFVPGEQLTVGNLCLRDSLRGRRSRRLRA